MYDIIPFEARKFGHSRSTTALDRFETWLRSHGYQPGRDPFFPADSYAEECLDAGTLVAAYLRERPGELRNREALLLHADEIGDAMPVWTTNGCGLPVILRELKDTAATYDRPCDPARDIHALIG
jgi:hypothetical protein